MLRANVPIKMPTTWGSGAKPGYIRTVGNPSQIGKIDGAASFTDGFPPLTFTPVAAGGVPPFGADMNGVLNQMTQWQQWVQLGGPIRYDSVFQNGVFPGGYPAEARVGSNTTTYLVWQSTADNNVTNPDTGTQVNWQTPVFPDVSNTTKMNPGLTITGATAYGANLAFVGNGTVTPRKWLRAWNGNLSVMNNANLNEIFTLNDAGDLSNLRNITAAGNVSTLNLSVSGSTTTGDITASGDVTSSGKLTGASLAVTGAATVGTSLTVGGATTLNNTLTVASATTLKTTLTVTGATTLSSSLSVTGTTSVTALSGTLTVTGAATMSSNLTVAGTTQTGALVTVNNGSIGKDFFVGATGWIFHWEDVSNPIDTGHPDGKAHHKYEQFNSGNSTNNYGYWFNKFNGATGDREWHGPIFNAQAVSTTEKAWMFLHTGFPYPVMQDDVYLTINGDLHLGQTNNWYFHEEQVPYASAPSGLAYHKITQYNGGGPNFGYWYDKWNGTNGDREWHGPLWNNAQPPVAVGDYTAMVLHVGYPPIYASHDRYLGVKCDLYVDGEMLVGFNDSSNTTHNSVIRFRSSASDVNGTGYIFRDNVANVITISASNTGGQGVDVDGTGNLTATGNISLSNTLYGGKNLYPTHNDSNGSSWAFFVSADGSGHWNMITQFNANNYTGFNTTSLSFFWNVNLGAGGLKNNMNLDGATGNLQARGTVHGTNVILMEQAIERLTARLNALDGETDRYIPSIPIPMMDPDPIAPMDTTDANALA